MPVDFADLSVGSIVRVTHRDACIRIRGSMVFDNVYEVLGWRLPSGVPVGNFSGHIVGEETGQNEIAVKVGHTRWNIHVDHCQIVGAPTRSPEGAHATAILKRLSELTTFHDVTVVADGCEMSASGNVLAAASPVLNAMLSTAMQEGTSKKIILADVSSSAVRAWLSYISTGELQAESNLLADIANLSDMYDMPELLVIVAERMCKTVEPDTAGIFLSTLRTLPQSKEVALAYKQLSELVRGDASLFEGTMNDVWVQRGTKRKAA